jgi:hypothetical protein
MIEHHLRIISKAYIPDITGGSWRIFSRGFYCGCQMWLSLDVDCRAVRYAGETPEKSVSSILSIGDFSHLTKGELVTMAEDLLREKFGQFLGVDFKEAK